MLCPPVPRAIAVGGRSLLVGDRCWWAIGRFGLSGHSNAVSLREIRNELIALLEQDLRIPAINVGAISRSRPYI